MAIFFDSDIISWLEENFKEHGIKQQEHGQEGQGVLPKTGEAGEEVINAQEKRTKS